MLRRAVSEPVVAGLAVVQKACLGRQASAARLTFAGTCCPSHY